MVDTNSDPREVEFVIPSNDDASKSIDKILSLVTAAIVEGLSDRGSDKEADATEKQLAAKRQLKQQLKQRQLNSIRLQIQ
jgi:small subunit ribosomal protein S2